MASTHAVKLGTTSGARVQFFKFAALNFMAECAALMRMHGLTIMERISWIESMYESVGIDVVHHGKMNVSVAGRTRWIDIGME